MARDTLPAEQILALLAQTPARIEASTADLTPAQLRSTPQPGEWSASDVLAHLRSCADMWGGYIARIVAEEGPTLQAVNPRAWIEETDYPELDFGPSLRAYTAQRAELLALLGTLDAPGWARSATLRGAGPVLHPTVLSYGDRLARHERGHLKQLERIARALAA